MSDKPLSFKERMALRAKEAQPAETKAAPVEEPKPMQPKRFGFPKPAVTTEATKDDPSKPLPSSTEQASNPSSAGDSKPVRKFGAGLPKISVDLNEPAVTEGPAQEVTAAVKEEAGPLPSVIQAYNTVGGQAKPTEGELLSGHEGDAAVRKIKEKILDLGHTDSQVELKYEMTKLSEMLVNNPAACLYLSDEDLGLTVQALRKLTNNRVAIDMAQAKPSKAKATSANKPLTIDEMQSAFDAL